MALAYASLIERSAKSLETLISVRMRRLIEGLSFVLAASAVSCDLNSPDSGRRTDPPPAELGRETVSKPAVAVLPASPTPEAKDATVEQLIQAAELAEKRLSDPAQHSNEAQAELRHYLAELDQQGISYEPRHLSRQELETVVGRTTEVAKGLCCQAL